MTRLKTILAAGICLGAVSAPAALADDHRTLIIEDFIGSVSWQAGDELSLDVVDNEKGTRLSEDGKDIRFDGGETKPDTKKCKGYYGKYNFDLGWKSSGKFGGYEDLEDYPVLEVTLPKDASVIIENAIIFAAGEVDIANLEAEMIGCGKIELGNVSNSIALMSKGSGDLTAGNTLQADIVIQGSGDVELGDVNELTVQLRGSGDVDVQNLGEGNISLSGSGDIDIGDVEGDLTIDSRGSGDISVAEIRGDLSYGIRGSGDFDADYVGGDLSLQSYGSGDIDISDGDVGDMSVISAGSGNASYDGSAVNANLKASGSADIYVQRVTGDLSKTKSGSADIDVDERD